MSSRLYNINIDAHNVAALAEFWRHVLGYRIAYAEADEIGYRTS